jgi:hypothetical protein
MIRNRQTERQRILGVAATFLLVLLTLSVSPAAGDWLPENRLTTADGASYLSGNNARCLVAGPAGLLHLVWYDFRDGDPEIYYRGFNGVAWGPETVLTNNTTPSEDPAAAVDSAGVLHVVWADELGGDPEIFFKSFDGATWTPTSAATDGAADCESPSLASDGAGNLHLVWRAYVDGGWGIFYADFDGATWSDATRLSDTGGYPLQASIACDDSGHIHVAWEDFRHLNWEIYYRRFNGTVWEPEMRLTNDTAISENPTVTVDSNGTIHLFYDDNRAGGFDIYQKTFDGLVWSDDEMVLDSISNALSPAAVAGKDNVIHLVWYDTIASYPEIFHMAFDGVAWGASERLTDAVRRSESPTVALDSNEGIHVAWHDSRHGNFEIYWKSWQDLPKPELISITPDHGTEYNVLSITDLAGAQFFGQVEVWLQKSGEADVEAANEVVVSATRVTCDLDLWDVALGDWDIVVENLDLQRDTLPAAFTVDPLPLPELTSIEPSQGRAYQHIHVTDLSGQGFTSDAAVWLAMPGEDDVQATNVTVESTSRITCDFSLTGVEPGSWSVYIRNVNGDSTSIADGFTVWKSRWDDDLRLTYDGAESSTSQPNARCIAVDGSGHLHVVWHDDRDGNKEIYYKMFDGNSWSADLRLTNAGDHSAYPAIAIDGNDNVHIVWEDYRDGDFEIYYKMFDGLTWSADERLTDAAGDSRYPSIAVHGNDGLYVVWGDKRHGAGTRYVYFREYDGASWQPEQEWDFTGLGAWVPAVSVDTTGLAHIVWYCNYGDSTQIRYLTTDGVSCSSMEVLAGGYFALDPTIAVDSMNRIHVAWHDGGYGGHEIFYRMSDGLTWGAEQVVASSPATSYYASIAADDSGNVELIWEDKGDGNYEIYHARNETGTWGTPTRLTNCHDESRYPSLALAQDGSLHMVWRDLRDGNREIYYKMRESGSLAGIGPAASVENPVARLRVGPNPLRISAQVHFSLGLKTEPVLSIYDIEGRLVRRIEPGEMEPGRRKINWDGKNAGGKPVAQGIYFAEVSAARHRASTKVLVLR